jgi:exosome complex component RRP4
LLNLTAINLPGGIQRRKDEEDKLRMREQFVEGDLIVAEV